MASVVNLPEDVTAELRGLVDAGEFGSVEEAAVAMIRRGLSRKSGFPGRPGTPPPPPGHNEPSDDRPIEWHPGDVNWV